MIIYSLGADFIPSDGFIQRIINFISQNIKNTVTFCQLLSQFFENSNSLNCGRNASFSCAVTLILNGKIDSKFDFYHPTPSKIVFENIKSDELCCCCFGDNVQRFADCFQVSEDWQASQKKTTDTIGFLYQNDNNTAVFSSSGMGQSGRLPLTVVPGVGLCDAFNIMGISTGFGEFLGQSNILRVYEQMTKGLIDNFLQQEYYGNVVEVIYESGIMNLKFIKLEFCRIDQEMNYFYYESLTLKGIISMRQVIIIILEDNFGIYLINGCFEVSLQNNSL
ncbi:hypothetical protein SS50377_25544 [Spironucleus salmonicida]|uniref:Uncharacterized protein n=1 Tax=Spironucleus salmonicida TaxID=348837 RepID=V6LL50_9EUKA|nr:hypothetical protein SS50377_25544 [Spironucleus salmonicida]|eukprot:EST45093.1 Hypothetical protein SS50377_15113 [Spironucleus salmonicida]